MLEDWTEATFKSAKRKVIEDVVFLECKSCGGHGELAGSHTSTCPDCKGKRFVSIEFFKEMIVLTQKKEKRRNLIYKATETLRKLTDEQLEEFINNNSLEIDE